MCASHHDASSIAAAGRPSRPISGPGPLDEAAAGISNRGSAASSAAVTMQTLPSSSAIRTRVPVTLTTTLGMPSTKIRSPIPTLPPARAAHRAAPARTTADMPSGTARSATSCRRHIR